MMRIDVDDDWKNTMNDLENFDDKRTKLQQYNKEYYAKNKEKLKQQNKLAYQDRQKDKIKQKYNNHEYQRIPHAKIKKYRMNMSMNLSCIF